MYQRHGIYALVVGVGLVGSCPNTARAANVGSSHTALPGLYRVPVAQLVDARASGALSLGYGMIEAQPGEAGAHQRMGSSVALAVVPTPRLQFSLRADARYERHPDDAQGPNSGAELAPTATARWVQPLTTAFALGFETGLWFPGTESTSVTLAAASPHAAALASWSSTQLTLTTLGGYRLNRSAAASPDLEQLRPGDRLALGLSDFDAALAGLGVGYSLGQSELFAEANVDLLVGAGAPPALQSPLNASAGARYQVNDWWTLELLGSTSLSERPRLAATDPLVPVDPRLAVLAGVRFRLPLAKQASTSPPSVRPSVEVRPQPAPPRLVSVQLKVRLDSAKPALAKVVLERDGQQTVARSTGDNQFEFVGIAPGPASLRVTAQGHQDWVQEVRIPPASVHQLEIELQAMLDAQIRGLVRSFDGRGLLARIRVEPFGAGAISDTEGFFELDVPPGKFQVTIEADGYRTQERDVVVEPDGVVILNVDLLKGP